MEAPRVVAVWDLERLGRRMEFSLGHFLQNGHALGQITETASRFILVCLNGARVRGFISGFDPIIDGKLGTLQEQRLSLGDFLKARSGHVFHVGECAWELVDVVEAAFVGAGNIVIIVVSVGLLLVVDEAAWINDGLRVVVVLPQELLHHEKLLRVHLKVALQDGFRMAVPFVQRNWRLQE